MIKAIKNVVWEAHPGSQVDFLECPADEVLLHGNRGGGKHLPNDTNILTPTGWVPIGDLQIGDTVFDRFGKPTKVTGVFPQGKKQVFLIEFLDGRTARCGLEHLWLLKDRSGFVVKSTEYLLNNKLVYHNEKSGNTYKYKLPLSNAVDFVKKEFPIDPYILGCLLGNGTLTTRTPKIATSSEIVLNEFRKRLPEFDIVYDKSTNNNYTIVDRNKGLHTFSGVPIGEIQPYNHNRLTDAIQHLKLNVKCSDKFIPDMYKFGSYTQRFELLQGLMDTDGRGISEFTNTSLQLVQDTAYICRSLGIKCRIDVDNRENGGLGKFINGVHYPFTNTNVCYRLYINTLLPIAKEEYKVRDIVRLKDTSEKHFTPIVSVIPLDEWAYQTCIAVESTDHTYIMEDFIVTHNTDCLLMDFLQDVGVGYGAEWRGVLFREEFTQLTDVINKSKKWINQIFPGAKWNGSEHKWTFPDGEVLYLRYMRVPADYWGYHGHEYPWIGWEELTNWATDECYKIMMSCNRSSNPYVPRKIRATCNPSGKGHAWVKHRFIDVAENKKIFRDPQTGKTRCHITSRLAENITLLEAQPDYQNTIILAAQDDPVKTKAWVEGSWDIVAGGFFSDLWDTKIHVRNPFPFPQSWQVYRSFDWGSTRPWCVSYLAECNGEQPDPEYGMPYLPNGSVICIMEVYGWNGTVNEGDQATSNDIAERVLAVDKAIEMEYRVRVRPGPADLQIWEVRDGTSIAANMSKCGLWWHRALKGSGSRVASLSMIRTMLGNAKRGDLEHPHLYFFDTARHHIRTFPLQQHDSKFPEDIDTDLEDHAVDSIRYGLSRKLMRMKRKKVRT